MKFLFSLVESLPQERFKNMSGWRFIGKNDNSVRKAINQLNDFQLANGQIRIVAILNACREKYCWWNLCHLEHLLTRLINYYLNEEKSSIRLYHFGSLVTYQK